MFVFLSQVLSTRSSIFIYIASLRILRLYSLAILPFVVYTVCYTPDNNASIARFSSPRAAAKACVAASWVKPMSINFCTEGGIGGAYDTKIKYHQHM